MAAQKALALAQDPEAEKLGIVFNGKIIQNGQHVPKAEAQSAPTLTFGSPDGPFIVTCIDLDAPFTSFPFLGPILHWIQPGLQPSASSGLAESATGQQLEAKNVPPVAEYAGPGPPPLSGPHRYVFMLYKEPDGFDGKRFGQPAEGMTFPRTKRMRYDFDGFIRDAKLGEMLAAHWFVSN